jgi:hypothetical protein
VIAKTLKDTLVCWPRIKAHGAIAEARILSPGDIVFIRENEERRSAGRMPVMLKGKILFCDSAQFWKAAR